MTDHEFLKSMSSMDEYVDHEDNCGQCCHQQIMAQVARELLASDDSDLVKKWSEITKERWEETKYFKLWQEETLANRDPNLAFSARGWEA